MEKIERIQVNDDCLLCGGCVSVCPEKVIVMHRDGLEFRDGCIMCRKCIVFCPAGALSEKQ